MGWFDIVQDKSVCIGAGPERLENGANVGFRSARNEELRSNAAIRDFRGKKLNYMGHGGLFLALVECIQYDDDWRRKGVLDSKNRF
jgi:hypothetical protein